jgi:serine acetyltransferase/thymidylate kinase
MRDAQSVLLAWLRYLDEKRIDHCLLRSLSGGGAAGEHGNAMEIAVARDVLGELPKLIYSFCLREDVLFVQRLQCEEQTWRHVLSWTDGSGSPPQFLCIDMTGDYYFAGRRLLSSERIQAMRIESVTAAPAQRIQIVGPNIEFMHRLLRCVTAQRCSFDEAQRLRDLWQRDPAGTANLLLRLWPADGSALIAAAACERWDDLIDNLPMLRKRLRPTGVRAISAAWRHWKRRWESWRHPNGLLVACLGPDGSGKRTLIAGLQERPPQPFEGIFTMRLRPSLIRQAPVNPTVKPWLAQPRSSIVVPAKLALFVMDYWLGYLLRMRPRLTRGGLVLSDRYYDDVLVDPRRYRLRRPYALARALVPWIPRPDLWLVLDAPAQALTERQREVTAEESSRLRSEYRRVLRGKDNRVVLDASRSASQVLAAAQLAIVKTLAQRTSLRLQLPQEAIRNPLSARVLLFFCRHRVPLLGRMVRAIFNSEIDCRLPPDIHLPHPYGILVHPAAVIGRRVTLMEQVTIGAPTAQVAPVIGDGVYVGEGARILGDVRIGDRAVIGANAVITKDVAPGATVVGTNRVVAASGSPVRHLLGERLLKVGERRSGT